MTAHPDFGKELRRPFPVAEPCYDCGEFYDGCNAWPASKPFRCADYLRLPDVMPGTCGQTFPPSRMQGRREPRVRRGADLEDRRSAPAQRGLASPHTGPRLCGCGAILPKSRRLCDQCQTQNRRQTRRDYMRTYMERRRSAAAESDSGVPFPAAARQFVQVSGDDLRASGQSEGGAGLDQTSVLTESVL